MKKLKIAKIYAIKLSMLPEHCFEESNAKRNRQVTTERCTLEMSRQTPSLPPLIISSLLCDRQLCVAIRNPCPETTSDLTKPLVHRLAF